MHLLWMFLLLALPLGSALSGHGEFDGNRIVLKFGSGTSQKLSVEEKGKILTVGSFCGARTDVARVGD